MYSYSANLSTIYRDVPLREALQEVTEAGLDAFEFLFVSAYGLPELVSARDEFDLDVALFDLDIGDPTFKSGYGYLCRPEGEDKFRRSLDAALEAARQLGCRRLNALAGRGVPELGWERSRDLVVQRLKQAAPLAASAGITLLVEAIADSALPGYLVNYSRQALEIVEMVGHPNVRFQADLYHMQLSEGNLIATLTKNIDRIGHVQVADVPGRHEPGTGEINYPNVLKALQETGYVGYVGLEYIPTSAEPFAWLDDLNREERYFDAA